MNSVIVRVNLRCQVCNALSPRKKSFSTSASSLAEARAELEGETRKWVTGLAGYTCNVCKSILNSMKEVQK